MARFGDGLAVDLDLLRAADAATAQALAPLDGHVPDLVCAFVCGAEPEEVAAAGLRVSERAGARVAVGCSAPGVIGAGHGVEATPAVSVWAAVLPGVELRAFHLDVRPSVDSLAVIGMPERRDDDALAVLLADPYSFPADGFVERSNEALGGLPLVGGLAAGLAGAGSTRLFLDRRAYDRGAVGVLMRGAVQARTLVSQGCRPIGPLMTVTEAEGNALLGLAGVPALTKLEEIVGELPPEDQGLAARGLHIGIAMDEYAEEHERGDFLIRGVLGVEPGRAAVLVGDLVEVGRSVRFQVRDAAAADEDLAGTLAAFRAGGGLAAVEGALLFSCNGRGSTLFASPDHDVVALRDGLGALAVAGFFAAGEIGPVGGRNHLHGFTASVLAFGAPGAAGGEDVRFARRAGENVRGSARG